MSEVDVGDLTIKQVGEMAMIAHLPDRAPLVAEFVERCSRGLLMFRSWNGIISFTPQGLGLVGHHYMHDNEGSMTVRGVANEILRSHVDQARAWVDRAEAFLNAEGS